MRVGDFASAVDFFCASEIAVSVFGRSYHQGKTHREAYRRIRMSVYESCHVVALRLAKKQHVAASSEKRIDATKQVGNFRRWFVRRERSNCQAKNPAVTEFVSPSSF